MNAVWDSNRCMDVQDAPVVSKHDNITTVYSILVYIYQGWSNRVSGAACDSPHRLLRFASYRNIYTNTFFKYEFMYYIIK